MTKITSPMSPVSSADRSRIINLRIRVLKCLRYLVGRVTADAKPGAKEFFVRVLLDPSVDWEGAVRRHLERTLDASETLQSNTRMSDEVADFARKIERDDVGAIIKILKQIPASVSMGPPIKLDDQDIPDMIAISDAIQPALQPVIERKIVYANKPFEHLIEEVLSERNDLKFELNWIRDRVFDLRDVWDQYSVHPNRASNTDLIVRDVCDALVAHSKDASLDRIFRKFSPARHQQENSRN